MTVNWINLRVVGLCAALTIRRRNGLHHCKRDNNKSWKKTHFPMICSFALMDGHRLQVLYTLRHSFTSGTARGRNYLEYYQFREIQLMQPMAPNKVIVNWYGLYDMMYQDECVWRRLHIEINGHWTSHRTVYHDTAARLAVRFKSS